MDQEEIDNKLLESEVKGNNNTNTPEIPPEADPLLSEEALAASETAAAEEKPAEEAQASESEAAVEDEGQAAAEEQGQGQDPKIGAAFAKQRHDFEGQLAESNQKLITAQQQLQQSTAAQVVTAPQEKSPEEKFIEEHPELEDDPFPARVVIAQRKFDKEQTARNAQVQQEQTTTSAVMASINKASISMTDDTNGVGFQRLLQLGQHLITDDDAAYIRTHQANAGAVMYDILHRHVKAAGLLPKAVAKTKAGGGDPPPVPKPKQQANEAEVPELSETVSRISDELNLSKL